ncbi:MAG: hypothetical protein AB9888_07955 [Bacteroidales bacterium]
MNKSLENSSDQLRNRIDNFEIEYKSQIEKFEQKYQKLKDNKDYEYSKLINELNTVLEEDAEFYNIVYTNLFNYLELAFAAKLLASKIDIYSKNARIAERKRDFLKEERRLIDDELIQLEDTKKLLLQEADLSEYLQLASLHIEEIDKGANIKGIITLLNDKEKKYGDQINLAEIKAIRKLKFILIEKCKANDEINQLDWIIYQKKNNKSLISNKIYNVRTSIQNYHNQKKSLEIDIVSNKQQMENIAFQTRRLWEEPLSELYSDLQNAQAMIKQVDPEGSFRKLLSEKKKIKLDIEGYKQNIASINNEIDSITNETQKFYLDTINTLSIEIAIEQDRIKKMESKDDRFIFTKLFFELSEVTNSKNKITKKSAEIQRLGSEKRDKVAKCTDVKRKEKYFINGLILGLENRLKEINRELHPLREYYDLEFEAEKKIYESPWSKRKDTIFNLLKKYHVEVKLLGGGR